MLLSTPPKILGAPLNFFPPKFQVLSGPLLFWAEKKGAATTVTMSELVIHTYRRLDTSIAY